ncbi:MAG TPA: TadE/TadG family type IV pilus assembly protein, partial [Asticcacaulis sp.]|nr:TadE/TadG family type IV pilus assembly protein [Asticcacaulis sp.]
MYPTRTLIKRFAHDRRGNVAILFALSAVAIVTAVGGALDFSRVEAARRHMQDAADSALLRAITLPAGISDAERQNAADTEFYANFASSDVHAITPELASEVDGIATNQTYVVDAKVPSYFAGLMGRSDYNIHVVSKAQTMAQKYEIALVLDSTGSMAQSSKMVNLKASVDSMLKGLLDASGKNVNDTKVAVVPFNTQVRMATLDCVSDRNHFGTPAYDVSADSPNAAIPASQYSLSSCTFPTLQPVKALTDDIGSVRGYIPTLTPGG